LTVTKIGEDVIIVGVLGLITIEFITTVWLIPFTPAMIWVTVLGAILCGLCFAAMLAYRQRQTRRADAPEPSSLR
jgi:hypothetical protein